MMDSGGSANQSPDDFPTDVPVVAHRRRRKNSGPAAATRSDGVQGKDLPEITVTSVRSPTPGRNDVLSSHADGTSQEEKAGRAPASWANFAPTQPRPRPAALVAMGRVAGKVGHRLRFLRHEWIGVVAGGLALALLLYRGVLRDIGHTLPQDAWDPSLVTYLISWSGHALVHAPTQLWHLNAFFPAQYGLAYSDSLLGYAPVATLGDGLTAAIVRYNLIFIGAQALAFIGAYALARQLGTGKLGATVVGVAFLAAPWRLGHAGHLHVISTGGIALALALLARGHGVRWRTPAADDNEQDDGPPPPRVHRPGWALAGWLVAAWQLTIGFGVGLVFMYVLVGIVAVGVVVWIVRPTTRPSRRLLAADLTGGAVFAAVALLMAQPYLKVLELYPYARRTPDWVALYSPPVRGFVTAPPESLIWGTLHATSRAQLTLPAEMDLLPGFVLYALAIAGVVFSIWSWRVRLALLGGVLVSIALGMGTRGPAGGHLGYLVLMENLPGFEGLRTPGRLVLWTTLLMGLLAGGAVAALARRAKDVSTDMELPVPTMLTRLALIVPVLLLFAEGLGKTPHTTVPNPPAALASVAAPYLILPSDDPHDMQYMLWSTDRFADLVNGGSSFVPTELAQVRQLAGAFPDQGSVAYLRSAGVRTVVVLPGLAAGTPWQDAATESIDGLGITRDVYPDAVVFHLTP